MAITVTRTRSATRNYLQHQSHLFKHVNFNDAGINTNSTASGALVLGVLPMSACPLDTVVRVTSAFSAGNLIISTSASSGAIANAGDIAEGSTGVTVIDRIASIAFTTADRTLYVSLSSTAATGGQADIWVRYLEVQGTV